MRKSLKKVCCYALSLSMALSFGVTVPPMQVRAEEQQTNATLKIHSLLTVTVDDSYQQTMNLFANGTYETKLTLETGTHTVQVDLDGTLVGSQSIEISDTISEVYIRYQEGQIYDSINNKSQFHTAAFTGNFAGLEFVDTNSQSYEIASWTPADANSELDYMGGGIFKRTFTFKALEENLTLEDGGYKIALDDGWDNSIGNGSGNVEVIIPQGTTSFTVFADVINGKVYDSVRSGDVNVYQNEGNLSIPAFDLNVSLIGTVRGGDDALNWNAPNTDFDFTQIDEKLYIYQKMFAPGTYEYKVVFNYNNWYNKIAGNKKFTVSDATTNVVFVYDAETEAIYDSINDSSKLSIMFGMEEEPATSSVVNNANGTTTFITTAAADESATVQLAYADRDTASEITTVSLSKQVDSTGFYKGSFTSDALFFGDDSQDVVYYYLINGEKVLDHSASSMIINGEVYSVYERDQFTGRLVCVPGTLPGNSWDAASNVMTYNGNGLYSYTFHNVPAANYQYKISMGTWIENYGVDGIPGGSNYSVTSTKTQDITIYYNDILTHNAVTSLDYMFVDVTMQGTGIPVDTKLSDNGLTGTYTATIKLEAGTYSDLVMEVNGVDYAVDSFTLTESKAVTFYYNPSMDVYYNNSVEVVVDATSVTYDSRNTVYKSTYGAIAEKTPVTFAIKTGDDVTKVQLKVRGKSNQSIELAKGSDNTWSGDLTITEYGEYQYFFVLYYGSSVKIYCDDDGYYGTGMLTDLNNLKPYDLVVYQADYKTPDWMKNAVVYQIFPDRFFNGDTTNDEAQTSSRGATDYEFITDWYTLPENPEQEQLHPDTYPSGAHVGDGIWSNEIYGGDLQGIIQRIDYLKALGVNVIYLNPVFASISTHRYDTSDYTKIDPILGDLGDFSELVATCMNNDMHIVLDGVFNHVSDDSIYFDRYYKFVGLDGKVGAYPYWAYVYDYMTEQSTTQADAEVAAKDYFKELGVTDFSYTQWFTVNNTDLLDGDKNPVQDTIGDRAGKTVYGYEGWWGYDSMPVVTSTNGSEFQTGNWGTEIIEGSNSITQYWLRQGSNGWRLDVANEVSDETWQHFRNSVKSLNSDCVIIGEIWDDATKYILGDMYDSVMNYVFRGAVLAYAKGQSAQDTMNTLEKIRERYPQEAFYAMMNLVGSHDTTRLLSYLDGVDDDRNQKDVDKAFPTYAATSETAKKMQYLVAFMQMTYPGAPTIYYGDELGMTGADDPDDRRGMIWGEGNKELVEWYATLAKIRSTYVELRTGEFTPLDVKVNGIDSTNLIGYTRGTGDSKMIVVANNAAQDITATLNVTDILESSVTTVKDLIGGTVYSVEGSTLEVNVPAYKGVILTTNPTVIYIDEEALKPGYDSCFKIGDSGVVTPPSTGGTTGSDTPSTTPTPTPTQAPTPEPVEYEVEDGTLKDAVISKDGIVTIPADIAESITSISSDTFFNNQTIKKVDLSNTKIEIISASAFKNCTNLKEIVLPATVEKIEAGAFRNCTSLTSIQLPSSVESVGTYAFAKCTNLTSITLERGFNGTINKNAFDKKTVTIYGYGRTKAQIAAGVITAKSIADELGVSFVYVKTSRVAEPTVSTKNSTIVATSKDKTVTYYQLWVWSKEENKFFYSTSKTNGKFKVEEGKYRIVAVRKYGNGDKYRSKSSETITMK